MRGTFQDMLGKGFDQAVPSVANLVGTELSIALWVAGELSPQTFPNRHELVLGRNDKVMLSLFVDFLKVESQQIFFACRQTESPALDEPLFLCQVRYKVTDGVERTHNNFERCVIKDVNE